MVGKGAAYVEEIITGHSGLAGHTSGDNDEFGTFEGLFETVVLGGETNALYV